MRKIAILFFLFVLSACTTTSHLPSVSPQDRGAALPAAPKNITLLLPLEGPNGGNGQAIRNGFLAAYYDAKQNGENAPTVNVVNTYGEGVDIVSLYQAAVDKGSDFVVGPLTKQEVQVLAGQKQRSVPILALNTLTAEQAVPNLYQFGLLPQDEAIQAAERMKEAGFSRIFMMTPVGSWGKSVAQAFEKKWQTLGGTVVYRLTYPPRRDLTQMLEVAFKKEAAQADAIFLIATPRDARQIKSLLTVYGARDLAVYATSLVYAGVPSEQDHDLEGISFNDMPWVLGEGDAALQQVRNNIQTLWGSAYNRAPRLYALGVDAYRLTYSFDALHSGMVGATGVLTIDANQRIHRRLDWAKFIAGVPQKQ